MGWEDFEETKQKLTAAVIVNKFGRDELAEIIRNYGEERHAKLVAGAICSAREKKKIETTGRLKEIIARAIGRKYRDQRLHPAARTFQALRICTNDELAAADFDNNGVIQAGYWLDDDPLVTEYFFDENNNGKYDDQT